MNEKQLIQELFRIQKELNDRIKIGDTSQSKILYSTDQDYLYEKASKNFSGLCRAKRLVEDLRLSIEKYGLDK
ncbi:MAG TPA: hypothetical protein DCM10_07080 [Xanthomarina gelatinilytica]|nr:hypothetical protein [Xanthomarina gelatinilytica]|tara:strand:- start:245 stop:463 length:219 start_codon:yes stop_codon:yes gene_type:complete